MTITFVTSNLGKVASLKKYLPLSINLEVITNIDLIEPQADSSFDVAKQKVIQAYAVLRSPVLIQDSSFHIRAINQFPGAYIKYSLKTLKLKGILKLMKNVEDRYCYFEDTIAYTEDGKDIQIFTSIIPGSIALKADTVNPDYAWSDVWRIFIPKDTHKPLSSLTIQEIEAARKKSVPAIKSCFAKFVEFLKEKTGS